MADHETLVDVSLILKARFSSALFLHLTETIGNPFSLLFSKAHLSKAFCEAARNAQRLLTRVDLRKWHRTVDDAAVAAVVSKCNQLTSLSLRGCYRITDAAVVAVASDCKQLTTLDLCGCNKITDAAVLAVASGCKQLTKLDLGGCSNLIGTGNITNEAVVAFVSGCTQLTTLFLDGFGNITKKELTDVNPLVNPVLRFY